jgi:hypothetical protein
MRGGWRGGDRGIEAGQGGLAARRVINHFALFDSIGQISSRITLTTTIAPNREKPHWSQ